VNEEEEDTPIYLRISETVKDFRVGMEVYLESNDEKIHTFVWDIEDAETVMAHLGMSITRAKARRAWAEGQNEDSYIGWLEEQWKGEGE
jgi:hypothetical protein